MGRRYRHGGFRLAGLIEDPTVGFSVYLPSDSPPAGTTARQPIFRPRKSRKGAFSSAACVPPFLAGRSSASGHVCAVAARSSIRQESAATFLIAAGSGTAIIPLPFSNVRVSNREHGSQSQ